MATTGSSSSAATLDAGRAPADLLVGFSTCDPGEADPAAVVRALASSLAPYEPGLRWQMMVAGAGSGDQAVCRMRDAVAAAAAPVEVAYALRPSDSLDVPYHGVAGRARMLHAMLAEAHARRARCLVVDPRAAPPPEWIDRLVRPLVDETADFVAPVYSRHPFAGGLVHGVVYPLFRALYGVRLRYPIASTFGCSLPLIDAVLSDPVWDTDAGQVGIDLWLAATAASEGFRLAQASFGAPADERAHVDLSTTVSQLVGFVFADMERRAAAWQRIRGSRQLPRIGDPLPLPDAPAVDAAGLVEGFRLGHRELQHVWAEVLPPLAILQWRRVAALPVDSFRVDDALWARTLYDFAMGHRLRVIARDPLLRSLTPLYLAWLASLVVEMRHLPAAEADARIERLCLVFEAEKPYLISQWRWPERFRPVKLRR